MSQELRNRLYDQLSSLVLVDPHTHINALDPASRTPADILGYHYYTELAHSAGMPKDQIEEPGLDPKEKVGRLMENLGAIDNSIQYSWFVEMAQSFFGFDGDRITKDNWEPIYDCAVREMSAEDWPDTVLMLSKLEAVFLTNDFDDPLSGFDTKKYIPCLRTDDLVFHLAKRDVQERLTKASGVAVGNAETLKYAIGKLFEHFATNNARACAISLPPDFAPTKVSAGRANTAITSLYAMGAEASDSDKRAVANFVFWTLAEYCDDFRLPFDLMIGVNRGVYEAGVFQGQDLYDSRVSLIQYKELFNAFPNVTFPVSVLASVTNQELTSYAWIFPNVVTNGHWWYSNTPTYIEHDAAARLEAVPRTKQIGYYSDMYKLEFALPKFNMYKRILAKILAEKYVIDRGWTEERAIDFGKQVLRGNVETIFRLNEEPVIKTVEPPAQPEVIAAAPVLEEPVAPFAPATDDAPAFQTDDAPAFQTDEAPAFQAKEAPALDFGVPEETADAQPVDDSFAPTLEVPAESFEQNAPSGDDIFSRELPAAPAAMEPETPVLEVPQPIEPQPLEAAPIEAIAPPEADDSVDDIFGGEDFAAAGGAQIGASPIEPAPVDQPLELPTPTQHPFPGIPAAEAAQPEMPVPAQPVPVEPIAAEPIAPEPIQPAPVAAAPVEDEVSIDEILDDEFAPPGFAPAPQPAPPQPAPIQPAPAIPQPELDTGDDVAFEAPAEQPFDPRLSPPSVEVPGEIQIDTTSDDDDAFPGIQV